MKLFEPRRVITPVQQAVWTALPGSQSLFLSSPIREVCFAGTRGPGKTDAMLMSFAQYCGRGYGDYWRGVIFRRNYKHLDDIISKSKRWFNRWQQAPKFLAGSSSLKWVWPTGEELLLRAFEDEENYWNFHGHEYPFIGWEELTGWATINSYESMKSCNRSSYQPIDGMPPIPRLIRSSTNPFGVGHTWVKRYFIDPNPYGKITTDNDGNQRVALFGSIKENPYLGPEYVKTLQSITDKNKRKAWLEGSWDITSGGMFDDLWDSTLHILHPFKIPSSWRIQRSFDWGSSKPFSVGWFATSDGTEAIMKDGTTRHFPPKTMFRIGEWYGTTGKPNEGLRMPAKVVAQGILSRERQMGIENRVLPGPADSAIYAVTDEASIGQNMESEGVYFTPADKRPGSRKNGWELMRDRLNAVVQEEEKAGLYIFDTCRDFIRTVPTIPRDTKDPDDVDCFVAGTLISCPSGQVPIELLKVGDFVNTPIGPRQLLKAGVAGGGVPQQVITIKLSDGQELCGTLDHKIYIENAGLRPLCRVSLGDTLTKEKHLSWLKYKSTTVSRIGDILARPISFVARLMPRRLEPVYCIGLFGKPKEDQYQTGWISTTSTTTQEITPLGTLNYKLRQTMQDTISKEDLLTVGISPLLLMRGEEAHRDKQFLEKILKNAVRTLPFGNLRALIVATLLQHSIHDKSFVSQKNAGLPQADVQKKKSNVLSAAWRFLLNCIPTKKCKPVVISVDGRYVEKRVYYLTVEQAHLFYANGVLSTNTDAEDHICDDCRYMVLSADHVIHKVKIGGH